MAEEHTRKLDRYSTAYVLAETGDLQREDWLALRRQGIGGSDVATICGLNKYNSPYALWLEKTGQLPPREVENEAMLWGNLHEETIAQEFARRAGCRVHRRHAMLQHPDYPWALANIDRYCLNAQNERGVLECKTTGFGGKEWDGDDIPEAYLCQVSWYLGVTGAKYGYIACLINGNRLVYKLVPRDDELIAMLLTRAAAFWQCVETMTPPEIDGHEATGEALDAQYPAATSTDEFELPGDAVRLIAHYDQTNDRLKALAVEKEGWANKLKAMMGDHAVGRVGDRKVTWPTITSQRINVDKLKAEQPEIYRTYTRPCVSRRFEVK